MSRKQTYYCDTCGSEFGDNDHINFKYPQLYIVYKTLNNRFDNVPVSAAGSGEVHFCNMICLTKFFQARLNEGYKKVEDRRKRERERR